MPAIAFNEDTFRDLLPLYYRRLFPYKQFFEWVTYGDENSKRFQNREFSFTLEHDIYVRYQSFDNVKEMEYVIKKKNPHKIDIGAIFDLQPKHHKRVPLIPCEKELVFDIDMTDYDDVRSCCQGADVCKKCWKFMAIACKVLDKALRDDLGYTHLLWVFSGRRGIHCWVCDDKARHLDNLDRAAVAGYLQYDPSRYQHPKRDKIHPSMRRALSVIEPEFVETLIIEQDALGTEEKVNSLIDGLPEDLTKDLFGKLTALATSRDRWNAVVAHIKQFRDESPANKALHQYAVEDTMLRYAYPRLDINVSTGLNHLLKAPFCVHPKSGKVCVPFNPKTVDKFDPTSIPTLTQLVEEVRIFDEKEEIFAAARKGDAAELNVDPLPQAGECLNQDVRVDGTVPMDTTTSTSEETGESPVNGSVASAESASDAAGAEPMEVSLPNVLVGDGETESREIAAGGDVPAGDLSDGLKRCRMEETPAENAADLEGAEVKALKAKLEAEFIEINKSKVIKDYKKTSMYKGILVFETFLRKLKAARSAPVEDIEDDV